jgi:hypothetical protein
MRVEFVEDGIPCLTQRTLAPIGDWHLLLGCMMLNQTHRRQARPALVTIFERAGRPEDLAGAEIGDALLPCGLATRRERGIREMTAALLAGVPVLKLPHIGDYAIDSWHIFARGVVLFPEDVGDHSLKPYLEGVWAGRWPAPEPQPR